ncbi:MAG: type II secretion system protein GspG [Campylobacteraceae bacterium 4484_166]|nr:MAG: type II secretion system protein GspG [Campylobacteraceae bacterium 4484_166]
MKKTQRQLQAFSLMELLIVILILGLLASLVLPNLLGKAENAKRNITCIQMNTISQSLKMYKLDNGVYPDTKSGLKSLVADGASYFSDGKIPLDSWKNEFIYVKDGDKYEIISLGADKKEGGTGESSDIKYSQCSK